jgi:hypothetical protein
MDVNRRKFLAGATAALAGCTGGREERTARTAIRSLRSWTCGGGSGIKTGSACRHPW